MPPTKLVRRPLLSAFAFPEVGLMRNRLRNILDDPTLRFFEEPVNEEMLPEAIGWYPAVDVTESPEEYTFIAELPGLKKEEVTISWDHDVLTIKGEKTREEITDLMAGGEAMAELEAELSALAGGSAASSD